MSGRKDIYTHSVSLSVFDTRQDLRLALRYLNNHFPNMLARPNVIERLIRLLKRKYPVDQRRQGDLLLANILGEIFQIGFVANSDTSLKA
jgi:hypothetical protein